MWFVACFGVDNTVSLTLYYITFYYITFAFCLPHPIVCIAKNIFFLTNKGRIGIILSYTEAPVTRGSPKKDGMTMPTNALILLFNLVFCVHNLAYLSLIEKAFKITSKKLKIVLFSALSGTAGTLMLIYFGSMSALGYGIMLAVFTLTVMLFYRGQSVAARLACVLSLNIHIMAMRAFVTGVLSLMTGESIYALSQNVTTFWVCLILTAALGALVAFFILRFVPSKYLVGLSESTEHLYLYIVTVVIANVYMIANGNVYIHDISYGFLPWHQLIAAFTWLLISYVNVVMLSVFKMMKERESHLEKDSIYKQVLAGRSVVVMDVNCTKDRLTSLLYHGRQTITAEMGYTEYIKELLRNLTLAEDYEGILKEFSVAAMREAFQKDKPEMRHNGRMVLEGHVRWVSTAVSVRQDEKTGDLLAVINITDDIHDAKMQETALRLEAERDALVGAYNKKAFEAHTKSWMQHGSGALFMIDLDNFKAINDNFGHAYGDEVLREVSRKIAQSFRSDDIMGRVGGDEFMVFVKNGQTRGELAKKAEKLCGQIMQSYTEQNVSVTISCSIGISQKNEDEKSFETLYAEADEAMYRCKKNNKNGFVIYEEGPL